MTGAILDHLWQSTLVALGLALLARALRALGPAFRHGMWFAASLKFLVPFAALAFLGQALGPAMPTSAAGAPATALIAQAAQPFSRLDVAPKFDAFLIIPAALWALGCGAILISWMVRWAKVRALARSATPLPWAAPMPVLASPSLAEPGLIGWRRPVLLLPESLPGRLDRPEIEALLAHEACHMRRHDNLTAAIHMLVEALFWFHPLVWWIGARMIEERERACDEAVVRAGHHRAAYARSLVESARIYLQSPLACVAGASGSDLKSRVEMIMTASPSPPLPRAAKALLLAAAACALASPVAAGWLTSPQGQEAAARAEAIVAAVSPGPAEGGAARPGTLRDGPQGLRPVRPEGASMQIGQADRLALSMTTDPLQADNLDIAAPGPQPSTAAHPVTPDVTLLASQSSTEPRAQARTSQAVVGDPAKVVCHDDVKGEWRCMSRADWAAYKAWAKAREGRRYPYLAGASTFPGAGDFGTPPPVYQAPIQWAPPAPPPPAQ